MTRQPGQATMMMNTESLREAHQTSKHRKKTQIPTEKLPTQLAFCSQLAIACRLLMKLILILFLSHFTCDVHLNLHNNKKPQDRLEAFPQKASLTDMLKYGDDWWR